MFRDQPEKLLVNTSSMDFLLRVDHCLCKDRKKKISSQKLANYVAIVQYQKNYRPDAMKTSKNGSKVCNLINIMH